MTGLPTALQGSLLYVRVPTVLRAPNCITGTLLHYRAPYGSLLYYRVPTVLQAPYCITDSLLYVRAPYWITGLPTSY